MRGALLGTVATGVLQSSSMVSVAVVGFADSGVLSLRHALAIIAGANVGTTLTPQIIASGSLEASVPLAILGLGLMVLFGRSGPGCFGRSLVGLAMVFVAMETVTRSVSPGNLNESLAASVLARPWFSLLAGTLATAVLQSSGASLAMIMALAGTGALALEGAIAFMLGANIGTCVTAVMASTHASSAGRRVAAGHFILNLVGAMLFMLLLGPFATVARWTSPSLGRQIANANSLFNIASSLLALPALDHLAWVCEVLLPDKKDRHPALQKNTPRRQRGPSDDRCRAPGHSARIH